MAVGSTLSLMFLSSSIAKKGSVSGCSLSSVSSALAIGSPLVHLFWERGGGRGKAKFLEVTVTVILFK